MTVGKCPVFILACDFFYFNAPDEQQVEPEKQNPAHERQGSGGDRQIYTLLLRILRMAESWRRLTGRGLGISNICAPQAESLSSSSSSRIR